MQQQYSLSVIVPIKISIKKIYLLKRLQNLINKLKNNKDIEIIIVDSSKKIFSKQISRINNIKYVYLKSSVPYSVAAARNIGAQNATGEYILFYDADLITDSIFFINVLQNIKELSKKNNNAFEIYPCLYLTEKKTKEIESKGVNDNDFLYIKERYLQGYNDEVLYLAVNTSTILVKKEHYFKVGGYNNKFKGHGYEDFELIHKLFMSYKTIEVGSDYTLDYKTQFPYHYKGFRKYYAYYALPNFFKNMFTLHLWHPRPLTNKYYRNRKNNLKYFLDYIKLPKDFVYTTNNTEIEYKKFINNLLDKFGYSNKSIFCGLREFNEDTKRKKIKFSIKRKIRRQFLFLMEKLGVF
jgi:predicted glycosyltransferase involved in capsule biosynthesis